VSNQPWVILTFALLTSLFALLVGQVVRAPWWAKMVMVWVMVGMWVVYYVDVQETTMELDLSNILTAVVVGVVALIALWMGKSGDSAASDIERAAGTAREIVMAAEQLWVTGKLAKSARRDWALAQLKEFFPGMDDETLIKSIEASVQWLRILRREPAPPVTGPEPTDITGTIYTR
jgi:hypothetical protein